MSILAALLGLDGGGLFGGMFNPTTAKTGSAWTNPQAGGTGPMAPQANPWTQLLAGVGSRGLFGQTRGVGGGGGGLGVGQQSSGVKPPKPVKPGQGKQHGTGTQNARKAMSAVASSGRKGGGGVKPPAIKISKRSRDYAKLRRRR